MGEAVLLPSPAGPGAGCRSPPHQLPTQLLGWLTEPLEGTGICARPEQHEAVLCNLGIFSSRDASRKEEAADHRAVPEVDRAAKVSILLLCSLALTSCPLFP